MRAPSYAPDWYEIARDERLLVDGVHTTAPAVAAAAMDTQQLNVTLEGWDVESTLWFRWRFSEKVRVGVLDENWQIQH